MALKTNQMQTDLKKYREEYDRIFGKKEKLDSLQEAEKDNVIDYQENEIYHGYKAKKNKIKEKLLTVIRSQTPMLPPICGNMSLCDYCKKDCIIFTTDDCDDFEYKGAKQ